VEVKLKATQKTVEKLFYVQPGADPSKIQVQVDGAKGLKLSKDGEIIIQTGLGELKLSKPVAWQEKDGKKLPVEVSYKLVSKNRYSFEVAKAEPSLPIVIDPILQSTYLGGNSTDSASAIAIHPTTGEVYVAGRTWSTNFPNTSGGAQQSNNGYSDAFVARLSADLRTLHQSTYLGGSRNNYAYALAIHPTTCDVYVAGYTFSDDFPNTTDGAQEGFGGGSFDAFVARLTPDLAAGSGSGSGSCPSGGGGSGSGGSGTGGSGGTGGGGGGCSMTGSASSVAGLWNILVWLFVPFFALARRIRRR
jgi:hypothetical protein